MRKLNFDPKKLYEMYTAVRYNGKIDCIDKNSLNIHDLITKNPIVESPPSQIKEIKFDKSFSNTNGNKKYWLNSIEKLERNFQSNIYNNTAPNWHITIGYARTACNKKIYEPLWTIHPEISEFKAIQQLNCALCRRSAKSLIAEHNLYGRVPWEHFLDDIDYSFNKKNKNEFWKYRKNFKITN